MIKRLQYKLLNVLKYLEPYTQTDLTYLTKGTFWLSVGQLAASGTSFITAIVFAWYLPKEVYGTYKYLLSIIGVFAITTLSGMGGALTQAVSRGFEGSFLPILKEKILWGLLGAGASILCSGYYFLNNNHQLAISFLIAAAFIPFMDSFTIYQSYLQGKREFQAYTIYSMISQFIAVAILIVVVIITSNLYIILLAYLLPWTVVRGFFLRYTYRHYPPNKSVDKEVISYGRHSSFIDTIATIISSVDQLLIFHFLGPVMLAIFSFAWAPVIQIVSLFRNLPTLAIPKLAERPLSEINKLLPKRLGILLGIAVVVTVSYWFVAPFIYKIFFPQYLNAIWYSQLLALTMLFTIPQTLFGAVIGSKLTTTPKYMLYLWNIPGISAAIVSITTISSLGLVGVIIARITHLILVFIISLIVWRSINKEDTKRRLNGIEV